MRVEVRCVLLHALEYGKEKIGHIENVLVEMGGGFKADDDQWRVGLRAKTAKLMLEKYPWLGDDFNRLYVNGVPADRRMLGQELFYSSEGDIMLRNKRIKRRGY